MRIFEELWTFLLARKKLWLPPIIVVILVLGGLFTLAKDDMALYRFYLSAKPNIQEVYEARFVINLKIFK